MGWVKQQVETSQDIFDDIVAKRPTWNGDIKDSSSAYEYWTDFIRDYYDVTLRQCDEICNMLQEYYGIEKFYYCDY